MDDKTLQTLTAMADKLGTTAEYLFGVLVRQAPITGTVDLLITLTWMGGLMYWARLVHKKTTKPAPTKDDAYPRAEWHGDGAFIACASVFVLGFITAFIGLFWVLLAFIVTYSANTTIGALISP